MNLTAMSAIAFTSLMIGNGPLSPADATLAEEAKGILQANCHRCHGFAGSSKGGFDFILDRDKLVDRKKLVPGKPEESQIYVRMAKGEMPPKGAKGRPSADELAIFKRWILAGAPATAAQNPREFLSDAAAIRLILADLQTVEPRQRRFMRYLTLAHLYNAGRSDQELQAYRQAAGKLLNSLSWHPRITLPRPIDSTRTILRLDLRDYQWNARLWDRILIFDPYRGIYPTSATKALAAATGSEVPFLKADWFIATASRAPLYYELLQMPTNDRELERQVRVDVLNDIEEESVCRAGFNDSGVSRNNRIIERHDASTGAYWRSYDFSDNVDRQNIFEHPLGPTPSPNAFVAAGGEIIFNLPNGLQAYILVDGNGRRVDRAAIEIVSDPNRPDRFVEAGLSCMSCHAKGLLPKTDQVRAHVLKNPNAFSPSDIATVKAFYAPDATLRGFMEADSVRYKKALAQTGVAPDEPEPISTLTLRYEATLDLATAAGELGATKVDFVRRLGKSKSLTRSLGPLLVRGGSIQRQVFLAAIPEILRELHLGAEKNSLMASPYSSVAVDQVRPFAGHSGFITAVALSPDGRRALSTSTDKTIRLWDVPSGRALRCLEGHTDEVQAVAFSPDGQRALSGGQDRSARIWDLASGCELRTFVGHTDKVSAVAFSPTGKQILTGSWDQTVRLWDMASGQEVLRLAGHTGWVTSVAFSPDGRQALSGSYDRTARLWNLANGRELTRLQGHTREIYSVAFSPDGRKAVTGGNDCSVRLWQLGSGAELRRFVGHSNAIIRAAFAADGRHLLAASSRYQGADKSIRIWDIDSGKESATFGAATTDTIWCLAFAANGRQAISGSSDKTLRHWNLSR